MAREWKLGKDMILDDNLLDPITFDELVMTVRCNCREVNEWTVRSTAREILSARLDDFYELLERNVGEIIKEVNKQKGIGKRNMEAMKKFKETEYEELIEKVIEWFEGNEEVFNDCIEELDSYNGYLGDDRYESMEMLNEIYRDVEPMELLYRAFYGHDKDDWTETSWGEKKYAEFNPNRDFFRYNGYGNLVSTDHKDYSDHLDSYFVEELIKNRNHVSWAINQHDELVELLDQIEAINDDIDEDEE